jgi:alkanesulfonate monooxygenase SsuD/methylene tetrahydromethanopterin reductase-like flavin-dependent oxidoreductase (luciferase family)
MQRIADFADGWMPFYGMWGSARLSERIEGLRAAAAAAGRTPPSVTIVATPPDEQALRGLEEAGADRAVFILPPMGASEVPAALQSYASVSRTGAR